jgi:uncharacterized OB-fold protein
MTNTEASINWQTRIIRQGWQCPVCEHVYSPDTAVCFYCPLHPKSAVTTKSEDRKEQADDE